MGTLRPPLINKIIFFGPRRIFKKSGQNPHTKSGKNRFFFFGPAIAYLTVKVFLSARNPMDLENMVTVK